MLRFFGCDSYNDREWCGESHTRLAGVGKKMMMRWPHGLLLTAVFAVSGIPTGLAQSGHPEAPPPPPGAKTKKCSGRSVPQFTDITAQSGIHFKHTSDPDKKYIIESMSGGVLLFDYDRDGWLDIYFTNAPTVAIAMQKKGSPGALYRNNHDETFTDVTRTSGLSNSCFAMGGAVGDYNNDGWPDVYLTCLGGNTLYENNGNGTFTDVTSKAGVSDGRWSTGAAFGDYDGDGFVDLMVTNYVDFRLDDLPKFGSATYCKYRGLDVQCGPRGLKRVRGIRCFTTMATVRSPMFQTLPGSATRMATMDLVFYGRTTITPGAPRSKLRTTPLRSSFTATWGIESSKRLALSRARR